jgi:hypothetical protein
MEEPKKQWRLVGLVTRGTILQTHEYYRGGAGFFGHAGAAGPGEAAGAGAGVGPTVPPPNKVAALAAGPEVDVKETSIEDEGA